MFKRIFKKISISLLVLLIFSIGTALAAGGLSIFTTYPSISVKPGENVQSKISVSNNTGAGITAALQITSLPEGWDAFIEGGSKIIDKVYVSDNDESINLTVKIPEGAKEGRYTVSLSASSGNLSDELKLEYNIKSDIDNKGSLETNYKELFGSSDTTFNYEIKITNNKNEPQTYSLGADTDSGWQVKFTSKYDSKQIASIPVEAAQAVDVKVEITPPPKVTAGEYVIPIAATSSGETLAEELKVIITGTYEMKLTTPTGRLNAETNAGKEKAVDVTINNSGSTDLNNIKLSSWQPNGWEVRFDNDIIDTIKAGESTTVKAYIKPDEKAITGDYVVEISADTQEASSSAQFRVMVKTSTLWGLAGIVVIVLLAYGLYWLVKKYGRR